VLAIPDAASFAGLESSLRAADGPLPVPPVLSPPSPAEQLESGRGLVRSSITRVWPAKAAGELLAVDVGSGDDDSLRVSVVHLGDALHADAVEGLGRSLGSMLSLEVQLVDVAIPAAPLSQASGDLRFVADVSDGVRASAAIASVNVCVVQPEPPRNGRRVDRSEQELADTLRSVLAAHPRVTTSKGEDWTVRFLTKACPESAAADTPSKAAGTAAKAEHR
jgi:hypothetical protein